MSKRAKFLLILFFVYGPLIIIPHELGHMMVFKSFGVRTEAFSFGFGPKLISQKIGGTEYRLSLLPLGGYVETNDKDMRKLSWWKMVIALSAGPFTGLLLFVPLLFIMKWKNKWKWKEVNLARGFWEMFTFLALYFAILNLLPIGIYPYLMLDGGQIFLTVWYLFGGPPNTLILMLYTFVSAFVLLKVIFTPVGLEYFKPIFRPYEESGDYHFVDVSFTPGQVKLMQMHGLSMDQIILLQARLNFDMHCFKHDNETEKSEMGKEA